MLTKDRSGASSAVDDGRATDRFIGRQRELDRLLELWHDATAAGRPRLGLVAGESGVGKSRLVDEFAAAVAAEDGIVLRGASFGTGFLAYEPWANALRDLFLRAPTVVAEAAAGPRPETVAAIPWLCEVVPGAPSVESTGTPTETAVTDVVEGILARLAAHRPFVIVLDDMQWADRASVELLTRLRNRAEEAGYLVLAVERRPSLTRGPWHEACDNGDAAVDTELALTRLDARACEALLASRAPEFASTDLAAAMYEASDGNAFVVRELLTYVVARVDDYGDDPAELAQALPQTAAALWSARLEPLSAAARRGLAVASVLGTEFDPVILGQMPDQFDAEPGELLAEATAAGLVERVGDAYRFGHGLLRDHLYLGLSKVRRQRLHRAIARVLEEAESAAQSGAPELAFHYLEAGRALRVPATRYTILAARWNFTQGASDTAADLVERARELVQELDDSPDVERERVAECRLALGEVMVLIGHPEFRPVLFAAAQEFERADDLASLTRCAVALMGFNDSAAMDDLDPVVEVVERILPRLDELPPVLVAPVCARFAVLLDFSGQLPRQQELSQRALAAARESEDVDMLAQALYCLRPGTAVPEAEIYRARAYELVELGRREHNVEYMFQGLIQVYWREVDLGDIDAADRALTEAEALAERIPRGAVSFVADDLKHHADSALAVRRTIQATLAGRFDEAERHVAEVAAFAALPGRDQSRMGGIVAGQLGQLADDRGTIGDLADAIEALVTAQPDVVAWQIYHSFVFTELGEHEKAARFYRPMVASELAALQPDHLLTSMLVLLARIAYARRDADGASLVGARLLPYSGRNSCNAVNATGPVDWAMGLCAATGGNYDEALALYAAALDLCRRMRSPSYEARTELAWAEALDRSSGDPVDCHTHVQRALTLATELGMAGVEREARTLAV